MRVFSDFHHDHLHESLRMLFEDRLGWDLYKPIGMDWYKAHTWNLFRTEDEAEQHLFPSTNEPFRKILPEERVVGNSYRVGNTNILRYLNTNSKEVSPGVYTSFTGSFPSIKYKAITLETFKSTKFDILVCTLVSHLRAFEELKYKYQPTAKVILQVGNNWDVPFGVEHALVSSNVKIPERVNAVRYHQEFSTDLFCPSVFSNPKSIFSMQNYIDDEGDSKPILELERLLHNWKVKIYGANNRDGACGPDVVDIANTFRSLGFLYHLKKVGDGYGYNIHHVMATGTPMIVRKHYFLGMTADPFLVDGKTCIDLDVRDMSSVVTLLRNAAEEYAEWSERCRRLFCDIVDFDSEFSDRIVPFLSRML